MQYSVSTAVSHPNNEQFVVTIKHCQNADPIADRGDNSRLENATVSKWIYLEKHFNKNEMKVSMSETRESIKEEQIDEERKQKEADLRNE